MSPLLNIFRGRIARGTAGSFVLQGAEAALGFVTSVVLARALGAAEFGAYAFAITLAGFLTIPGLLGFNGLAVREVAARKVHGDWEGIEGFVRGAFERVLLASLAVTGLAFGVLLLFGNALATGLLPAAFLGLAIVPVMTLLRLYEGCLRGIGHVVAAQLPDRGIRPLLFLLLAVGAVAVSGRIQEGRDAVLLNLIATAFGLIVLLGLWRRLHPGGKCEKTAAPRGDTSYARALPFALIAAVSVINTQSDVLMLGVLGTPEDTGVYRVASRVASLVAFALMAVAAVLGPRIAALHAQGNIAAIQDLAAKGVLSTTAVALPMALLLIFGGHWVMLLFGNEFTSGDTVLSFLSIGQLINAIMGVVAILLSMTGHERLVAKTLGMSALLNVILNGVLIPYFGAVGASVATMITYFVWNAALAWLVRQRLNVHPTIFGAWRALRPKQP